MSKQRGKLVLSSAEKEQLRQLLRAQSTPQGFAQRGRIVQLAAQGMGVSDSRSACTITRSRSGGGDISEVGSGRCRMSRARAAKEEPQLVIKMFR
jgi:hypothetical protein